MHFSFTLTQENTQTTASMPPRTINVNTVRAWLRSRAPGESVAAALLRHKLSRREAHRLSSAALGLIAEMDPTTQWGTTPRERRAQLERILELEASQGANEAREPREEPVTGSEPEGSPEPLGQGQEAEARTAAAASVSASGTITVDRTEWEALVALRESARATPPASASTTSANPRAEERAEHEEGAAGGERDGVLYRMLEEMEGSEESAGPLLPSKRRATGGLPLAKRAALGKDHPNVPGAEGGPHEELLTEAQRMWKEVEVYGGFWPAALHTLAGEKDEETRVELLTLALALDSLRESEGLGSEAAELLARRVAQVTHALDGGHEVVRQYLAPLSLKPLKASPLTTKQAVARAKLDLRYLPPGGGGTASTATQARRARRENERFHALEERVNQLAAALASK